MGALNRRSHGEQWAAIYAQTIGLLITFNPDTDTHAIEARPACTGGVPKGVPEMCEFRT